MKVTFIICTRDRSGTLVQTLDSILLAIEMVPTVLSEIIVVDNASKDRTSVILKGWSKSASDKMCNITLLYNPKPGLSGSRNIALAKSSGDILIFTDDDCIVSERYLEELVAHYARGSEIIIRGGRVELGSKQDVNFTTKTEDQVNRLSYPVHPGGFIHGCNMTCSRGVIDRIGGFDVAFGAGSAFRAAEDTDFIYRGWAAGIPVEYVPDMSVKHFHGRRDARSVMRLHWNYHFGNGALYAKHIGRRPRLYKHLYWAARNAAKEIFGGQPFDKQLYLTWRSVITANLAGFLAFYWRAAQILLTGV